MIPYAVPELPLPYSSKRGFVKFEFYKTGPKRV